MQPPQEEREFQQRLLALAGIGPAPGGGGGGGEGAPEGEEAEYASEDEVDPDDLSYEEVRSAAAAGWRAAAAATAATDACCVLLCCCWPLLLPPLAPLVGARYAPAAVAATAAAAAAGSICRLMHATACCASPQLTALGEAVGTVSKGIPAEEIEALPQQVRPGSCGQHVPVGHLILS